MPKIGNIWAKYIQIRYSDPDDDSTATVVITGVDGSVNTIKNIRVDLSALATEGDRTGFANVVAAALQELIDNRFTE